MFLGQFVLLKRKHIFKRQSQGHRNWPSLFTLFLIVPIRAFTFQSHTKWLSCHDTFSNDQLLTIINLFNVAIPFNKKKCSIKQILLEMTSNFTMTITFLGSTCSKNEFICKDGTCVDLNDRCNGRFECPDQSDELDCQGKYSGSHLMWSLIK